MINRIEDLIHIIQDYLNNDERRFKGMIITDDECRFIVKCLTQYQAILIKEKQDNE